MWVGKPLSSWWGEQDDDHIGINSDNDTDNDNEDSPRTAKWRSRLPGCPHTLAHDPLEFYISLEAGASSAASSWKTASVAVLCALSTPHR